MRILVFAHYLEVGGTQVNAIELSVALRDAYGHDVTVFATPGPMKDVLKQKGLRYIPAPVPRSMPSIAMMRALEQAVRQCRPDVIHVWDWWQCMNALYAAHIYRRVPMVVTDMLSVGGIENVLPKSVMTTFGTPERVDWARAERRKSDLLLPPVDVNQNQMGAVDTNEFRSQNRLADGDITIVTVSRLDEFLKLDSLRRTIKVVGDFGHEFPVRLIIVGDGKARGELQRLADASNAKLGREAVSFTGQMLDPRPAYAAADIVIGMGGSALRAMAFAKPVVVVGGEGFAKTFAPETADSFLYYGFYGVGDGGPENTQLVQAVRQLASSPEKRAALGAFSRSFVQSKFSLEAVSELLHQHCVKAAELPVQPVAAISDGFRTAALLSARRLVPNSVKRLGVVRKVGQSLGLLSR
jgi:glycosyltransferase involved in cell wall biosynthesis